MAEEKRAAPRVEFEGRTVVFVGDQQVVCKGGNLSSGGMLVFAPLRIPIGQTIKLAFALGAARWVNIEARVVRQAEDHPTIAWGLEFVRVSRDAAALLSGFVAERLGLGAPAGAQARGSEPGAAAGPASRPGRAPSSPGLPAPAPRASRSSSGLFARLKDRLAKAWTGDLEQPAEESKAGTSYALRPGSQPARSVGPAGSTASTPAASSAPPAKRPDSELLEDVPESDGEDVLPHDDVLGDVEKLSGSDRRLRSLYRAALKDVDKD